MRVIPQHQAQRHAQTHTRGAEPPVRAGYPQKHGAPLKALQTAGDCAALQMELPAVQPLAEDNVPAAEINAEDPVRSVK